MKADARAILPMIAGGMLVTFVTVACARLAFGLILPFMREDLGLSYQQSGNLGTAASLGYLCLVMVAGAFAARRGGRSAVVIGTLLTTAGFIGLTLASGYPMLFACMLMLGCGTAFAYTPVISLLAGCFPERRGMVIGAINSGIGIGLLASSALVPWLAQASEHGWRHAWAAFALFGALATAAALAFLPGQRGGVASAGGAAPASVSRNPRVRLLALLYGIVGMTYIAQSTFMYSYALDAGLTPAEAGRLAAMMGLLSVGAGPGWGTLSDRIGRARALAIAMSLCLLGTAIPLVWSSYAGFALHYLILGCTVSGMFTSILATAAESVAPPEAPRATSFVTLFYAIGQLIGPALAGVAIDVAGFRTAFAGSCLLMLAGVWLCGRLRRLGPAA
ncbi:MFS transporter [Noviherbaspirillum aridicola]|uniref:MFS transporter n=1 Tax=Noviherbaspirillum aridicola TaxID=2849687 RepID=A0ABQ4Q071_9BURK|nr:MFS transporter [Noviherbaspirillum aridicola]GIZ50519.1 MFS transporter [Noviherbaspirillum aridicola]